MTQSPRAQLAQTRRPVIKIGSAVLAGGGGQAGAPTLDRERFSALCDDVAAIAGGGARLPILVSSGYNENEVARRFAGSRVAGYVRKPYTSTILLERIKAVAG